MKTHYCKICKEYRAHKRHIGIGSLILVFITWGLWILALPFYPVRCTKCGNAIGTFYDPNY